jgi:hypothetical protein
MANTAINWDDPEERAKLVESIGLEAYNEALAKHIEQSTVAIVAGHSIRPVETRFGKLWLVGNTGRAFSTLKQAETWASSDDPE